MLLGYADTEEFVVVDGLHQAALLHLKIRVFSVTHVFEHCIMTMRVGKLCLICMHIHIQTSGILNCSCVMLL